MQVALDNYQGRPGQPDLYSRSLFEIRFYRSAASPDLIVGQIKATSNCHGPEEDSSVLVITHTGIKDLIACFCFTCITTLALYLHVCAVGICELHLQSSWKFCILSGGFQMTKLLWQPFVCTAQEQRKLSATSEAHTGSPFEGLATTFMTRWSPLPFLNDSLQVVA